ncbi:MAG: cytochrome c [Holophagales bacterium]|nr:cytochrome c [Holophagales bacterium]
MHVFALPADLPVATGRSRTAATDRDGVAVAAGTSLTVWDGVYTVEQAERGTKPYVQNCATCHGEDLGGGSNSPGLVGVSFQFLWGGKTLHELYEAIRTTMPTDNPGSLPRETYLDILTYMLQVNEFPAGSGELDAEALGNILITEEPGA